jgi:glycosyltransferase involved in cell wall biosynthesis
MNTDIENSDHIIANSEFVKSTLVSKGVSAKKVSVIELAVEEKFLKKSSELCGNIQKGPAHQILFAGSWIPRKGVNTLFDAVSLLDGKVMLKIAGISEKEFIQYCNLHNADTSNIIPLGYLSRDKLCEEMLTAQIFVFPSFCEGYAKTIQEAMVCGCYIIATRNSGFSLKDGIHGLIVKPGDEHELASSILSAVQDPNLKKYCQQNRNYAIKNYSAASYASSMTLLYRRLLNEYL